MSAIHNAFSVPFEYPVIFTDSLFDPANNTLSTVLIANAPPARAVVFLDQALANHGLGDQIERYFAAHRASLKMAAPVAVIPGGEAAKQQWQVFEQCVRVLRDARLDRHSYVIIVGGGAVLDAAGLAASLVHRGLRQIRVPTTVLAQNDAGVGVNNGIDFDGQKNFLGTFSPPTAVINDFSLLATLSPIARRDGHAEAVKVAAIRDASFFEWLDQNTDALAAGDDAATRYAIRRCAELHVQHIGQSGDPFERGSARPLDFGHWAAHKLEQLSDYRISHGQSVAVGIGIDTAYSMAVGMIAPSDADRVTDLLRRLGFTDQLGAPANLRSIDDLSQLLSGLDEFQEHLGGQLCITLLAGIGRGVEVSDIDRTLMRQCCAEVLLADHREFHRSDHAERSSS